MKKYLNYLLFLFSFDSVAQLYFPPTTGNSWETISPSELNWCEDSIDQLYDFLDDNNTKAFILLKDGKIVLEKYFDDHTENSNWYWASAGKALSSFLVGIAQQEGALDITDPTSEYLGEGWTSCTKEQEDQITIWHQLTMTTGLDDEMDDIFCTDPQCLVYKTDAGQRWAYHNGPYTLLDEVLEAATSNSLNPYARIKLRNTTGMDGAFIPSGHNNVFYSTARSMARFGLLILNKGNWDGTPILSDSQYFDEMTQTSQELNLAYGYLWWLNGKGSFMTPRSQAVIAGYMNPNAPEDMYAALGKNGQFINVAPSQNMVWIRMGEAPDDSLVPFLFNDDIWKMVNALNCEEDEETLLAIDDHKDLSITLYPNPTSDYLNLTHPTGEKLVDYRIHNLTGQLLHTGRTSKQIPFGPFKPGIYTVTINVGDEVRRFRIIKR